MVVSPLKNSPNTIRTSLSQSTTMITSPWWWTTPGIWKVMPAPIRSTKKVGLTRMRSRADLSAPKFSIDRHKRKCRDQDRWVMVIHSLPLRPTTMKRHLPAEVELQVSLCSKVRAARGNNCKRSTSRKSDDLSRKLCNPALNRTPVSKSRDLSRCRVSKLSLLSASEKS